MLQYVLTFHWPHLNRWFWLCFGSVITSREREKFLSYLESATERYGAVVYVYCLLDNHYHLLLETPLGNLSKIMQHINGAHTTYFNIKRARSGHLFQGRYKAILVEADEYAKELSRYMHLNPVRASMVKTPEEYRWSSCRYYTVERKAPIWLSLCKRIRCNPGESKNPDKGEQGQKARKVYQEDREVTQFVKCVGLT